MNPKDFSEITVVQLPAWRIGRYAVISPLPEEDAMAHVEKWAENSGLLAHPGYSKRMLGWDFPFVTKEQNEHFGMHGYVAAIVIPDGFDTKVPGVDITFTGAGAYAKLSIQNPFDEAGKIPHGFELLLAFAAQPEHMLAEGEWGDRYLMEEVRAGETGLVMDIYFPVKQ